MSVAELPSTVDRPFAPPLVRSVVVELPGPPKGKGRPRFSRKSGFAYTPETTRNYEAQLKDVGDKAMRGAAPIEGPLKVEVFAGFPVPQSWSRKKQAQALRGQIRPTGKPDLDNILKCLDALNAIVWRDDAQIVIASIIKRYTDRPRLRIEVEAIYTGGA